MLVTNRVAEFAQVCPTRVGRVFYVFVSFVTS
jgi:hypothetical protein